MTIKPSEKFVQALISFLTRLITEGEDTNLTQTIDFLQSRPREARAWIRDELCQDEIFLIVSKSDPSIDTMRYHAPRFWFHSITFSDGEKISVRQLVKRILDSLFKNLQDHAKT